MKYLNSIIKNIYNIKRLVLYLFFIYFIPINNPIYSQNYHVVGKDKFGIAFGNPKEFTGIKLNLIDKDQSSRITGINFSIINKCEHIYGLNLSIVNLFEYSGTNSGITTGLDVSILSANRVHNITSFSLIQENCKNYGFNFSLINNSHDRGLSEGLEISIYNNEFKSTGVSISIINKVNMCKGLQIGLINENREELMGVQMGLLNHSSNNFGLQIGLVNYSRKGKGIQLGLINIRKNNPWYCKVLPLINFKMNNDYEQLFHGCHCL